VSVDWWDEAQAGDEHGSFLGQAAGDSIPAAAVSTENCLLCDYERLSNAEVRNVRLVAENDSMRRWVHEADELVYQIEQRVAHREGRMPDPRMTNSASFVERLRLFDSAVARVMTEYDRGVETKQKAERLVAQHENSIALLEQRLRETIAGTVSMDELLRHERNLATATTNDLKAAQSTVAALEESLQQKSAELDEAAVKFGQLRNEAKARLKELKSQLETKAQEYRNLSAVEAKLNMELEHANDQLATEKAGAEQYRENARQTLENFEQLVSLSAVCYCTFLSLVKSLSFSVENKFSHFDFKASPIAAFSAPQALLGCAGGGMFSSCM